MRKRAFTHLLNLGILTVISSCTVKNNEPIQIVESTSSCDEKENEFIVSIGNDIAKSTEEVIEVTKDFIENENNSITISAVGDCTLGYDDRFSYTDSLPDVLKQQNYEYGYFFDGVYDILSNDDVTIANLESPLTDSQTKASKQFAFKGPSEYTNILIMGSVEAVNLANNHTMDYLEEGYNDTLAALEQTPIEYFGNGTYSIIEVNGKKIGMCGIKGWDEALAYEEIDKAIAYFDTMETDLKIFSFHWGVERKDKQNSTQENIGRYAIDCGADLVLGHHPHVLQGIECYNGKYIVYSLGNFVFGGNKNPRDKDSMIFQITFNYEQEKLVETEVKIIPVSISSTKEYNDYQPQVVEGAEEGRVLRRILDSSTNFDYEE